MELSRAVQRGQHIEVEVTELSHAHRVQSGFRGTLILERRHRRVLFGIGHLLLTVHIEQQLPHCTVNHSGVKVV